MWQPLCGVESTCDADDRFVELREHHFCVRLLRRPAALHRLPRTIARGFHLRASPKPRPRLLGSAARPPPLSIRNAILSLRSGSYR